MQRTISSPLARVKPRREDFSSSERLVSESRSGSPIKEDVVNDERNDQLTGDEERNDQLTGDEETDVEGHWQDDGNLERGDQLTGDEERNDQLTGDE
jgi:hypothetical protein